LTHKILQKRKKKKEKCLKLKLKIEIAFNLFIGKNIHERGVLAVSIAEISANGISL